MSRLGVLKRNLTQWARHESPLAWRYGLNLGPTLSYRLSRPSLTEVERSVVAALDRDGVAITSVGPLGIDSAFEQVRRRSEELVASADRGEIDESAREKSFVDSLLGSRAALQLDGPFAQFALLPELRRIANTYFGMYTQLRFFNVWRNRVSDDAPTASQLWHRDREDQLILKAFVYLRDVDDGAGPLRYARATHRKGRVRQQPESFLDAGVARSTDEHVSKVVPRHEWVTARGPAGTVVFADTRGLHCGGLSRDKERLLFTLMYTSRDSQVQEWFTRDDGQNSLDAAVAFAVGNGRSGPAWVARR